MFSYSEPYYELPLAGFKCHISATWRNYQHLYARVLPWLVQAGVVHKWLSNPEDIKRNLSKDAHPSSSGKLITVYPKNTAHARATLEGLHQLLGDALPGIYIQGDRNYKTSQVVFYRYGGFIRPKSLPDGQPLVLYHGTQSWTDKRLTYFNLPDWISDLQPPLEEKMPESLLDLQVDKVLKVSNGGDVYRGHFKSSGQTFVMKAARHGVHFSDGILMTALRDQEYELAHLAPSESAKPLKKIESGQITYYLYELITGKTMVEALRGCYDLKVNQFQYNQACLNRLKHEFLKLLRLVARFHQKGIILNDIHIDNFVRDRSGQWHFVDLNTSYQKAGKRIAIQHRFARPDYNLLVDELSDLRKLGQVFLFILARLDGQAEATRLYALDGLLANFGIVSNLSEWLSYCLIDQSACLELAIRRLESVDFLPLPHQVVLKARGEEKSGEKPTPLSLLDRELKQGLDELIGQEHYDAALDLSLKQSNLGMAGVSGCLYYCYQQVDDFKGLGVAIDELISRLTPINETGLSVEIAPGYVSPYLSDGASGVIQLLLVCSPKDKKAIIERLMASLPKNYAQQPDYAWGMLGIVETYLKCYQTYGTKPYFEHAEFLMRQVACFVQEHDGQLRLLIDGKDSRAFLGTFNHLLGQIIREKADARS